MNHSIKPGKHELSEARQIVETTIKSAKPLLEKEEDFTVNLGHVSKNQVADFGAYGEAENAEMIQIFFNTSVENWKEHLEELAIDVYGQAWFYEKQENIEFVWQQALASITGLMLLDKMSKSREPDYSGLEEEWGQKKDDLSVQILEKQENLSWQLKLILGRKLLEQHDLSDLPDLKRSDILETGDEAFL